jgi:hypothetical protein
VSQLRPALYVAAGVLLVALALFVASPSVFRGLVAPFLGPPVVDCDGVDRDVCEKAWRDVATAPGAPGLAGVTSVSVKGAARDSCPEVRVDWWGGFAILSTC